MLFCQLGRAHGLRDICGGIASVEDMLSELGVGEEPTRATLSYANEHRPCQFFESVFGQSLRRCRALEPKKPSASKTSSPTRMPALLT